MIADMKANKKKLSPIVAEFFFRRKKLNNSLVFISVLFQRLSATHYFIIKIPNKRELQQIASNLFDTEFEDFMKPYMDCRKSHIS